MKGMKKSRKKWKLSPRDVAPYQIMERLGPVAYRVALLAEYLEVHDVFHISSLRKIFGD